VYNDGGDKVSEALAAEKGQVICLLQVGGGLKYVAYKVEE